MDWILESDFGTSDHRPICMYTTEGNFFEIQQLLKNIDIPCMDETSLSSFVSVVKGGDFHMHVNRITAIDNENSTKLESHGKRALFFFL